MGLRPTSKTADKVMPSFCHQFSVEKKRLPACQIIICGYTILPAHTAKVVFEPSQIKVIKGRSGNGPQFSAKRAALLKQTAQLIRRWFTALGPNANVVDIPVVVPDTLYVKTCWYPHDCNILPRLHVAQHFIEGDNCRTYLIPVECPA